MRGRAPVTDLTAADFEVHDNGVVQKVELVESADIPVNVTLAIDRSSSLTGTGRRDLTAASNALLDALKPADRAALVTFSHAVMPQVLPTEDFAAIRAELGRLEPTGRTSVMDAVYIALVGTLAQPGRSLVVVCTDGGDTSSWLRVDDALESAKRASAVIYAVTATELHDHSSLQDIAEATGGHVIRAESKDLPETFRHILQEFRSRYVLTYVPAGVASGGFHRLEVRVTRRGTTVTARPGYIGVEGKK
jgi:VWFA-related protein